MVKSLFTREGTERNSDHNRMENFLYEAIYDILQKPMQHKQKITALKRLKAKIVRLNNISRQKLMTDTGDEDKILGETPFLHHIMKTRKCQESRTIKQICDEHGTTHATSMAIIKAFTIQFRAKFQPIRINEENVKQLLDWVPQTESYEMNTALEDPISMNELWHAISKGKSHKAPGQDGIGLEFYKAAWETMKIELLQLMNCMYLDGTILGKQLQGLIVCIPKHAHPHN